LQHGGNLVLHAKKRAGEVDVDDALPFSRADVVQRLVARSNASVVEHRPEQKSA
jgi:hypothetical protein